MYYYNCAYILDTSVSGNKADLSVLVIDVKNRMANNSENAAITVTAPTADNTNFTALKLTIDSKDVTTASTTVKKGDVIVVTGTAINTGDGAKLTLTHAKFSDGTGSKDNIKGDFSYEIYADSEGAVSLTQAAGTHHA